MANVVKKGSAQDMNRVRIEQLLRGAVRADLMLLQLRLKEKKTDPPPFLELLSQIRAEEEHERSRHKVHARVRSVGAQDCVSAAGVDSQELKSDVKAFQDKMSELKMKFSPVNTGASTKTEVKLCTTDDKGGEASALQKIVDRLSQKVKTLKSREQPQPATATAVKVKINNGGSNRRMIYFVIGVGRMVTSLLNALL